MTAKIAKITLDSASIKHLSMEVEHERTIAVTDLLHDNQFEPVNMKPAAYELILSVSDGRLLFDIFAPDTGERAKVQLSVQPLKTIIRDYFMICESYYDALKNRSTGKLEAVDAGRRGIHNEGSELLQSLLEGRIKVNFQTARRLFTLICVLHIKQ
jgi:uncharacterized protein (UPF0262 family)